MYMIKIPDESRLKYKRLNFERRKEGYYCLWHVNDRIVSQEEKEYLQRMHLQESREYEQKKLVMNLCGGFLNLFVCSS